MLKVCISQGKTVLVQSAALAMAWDKDVAGALSLIRKLPPEYTKHQRLSVLVKL